ncbi:hypothetical protein NFJ02_03g99370 [Pycnococcus provasolii]
MAGNGGGWSWQRLLQTDKAGRRRTCVSIVPKAHGGGFVVGVATADPQVCHYVPQPPPFEGMRLASVHKPTCFTHSATATRRRDVAATRGTCVTVIASHPSAPWYAVASANGVVGVDASQLVESSSWPTTALAKVRLRNGVQHDLHHGRAVVDAAWARCTLSDVAVTCDDRGRVAAFAVSSEQHAADALTELGAPGVQVSALPPSSNIADSFRVLASSLMHVVVVTGVMRRGTNAAGLRLGVAACVRVGVEPRDACMGACCTASGLIAAARPELVLWCTKPDHPESVVSVPINASLALVAGDTKPLLGRLHPLASIADASDVPLLSHVPGGGVGVLNAAGAELVDWWGEAAAISTSARLNADDVDAPHAVVMSGDGAIWALKKGAIIGSSITSLDNFFDDDNDGSESTKSSKFAPSSVSVRDGESDKGEDAVAAVAAEAATAAAGALDLVKTPHATGHYPEASAAADGGTSVRRTQGRRRFVANLDNAPMTIEERKLGRLVMKMEMGAVAVEGQEKPSAFAATNAREETETMKEIEEAKARAEAEAKARAEAEAKAKAKAAAEAEAKATAAAEAEAKARAAEAEALANQKKKEQEQVAAAAAAAEAAAAREKAKAAEEARMRREEEEKNAAAAAATATAASVMTFHDTAKARKAAWRLARSIGAQGAMHVLLDAAASKPVSAPGTIGAEVARAACMAVLEAKEREDFVV